MTQEEVDQHKEAAEEFTKYMNALAKKYKGKTVIANYYQLGRVDGKNFDLEARKKIKTGMPVEMSHILTMNTQWANCGKVYDIDEKATIEWEKNLASHKANLADKEESEKALSEGLKGVIKSNNAAMSGKKTAPKDPTTWGVNKDFELSEGTEKQLAKDGYDEFTGSKIECETFVVENKPAPSTGGKKELKADFIEKCEKFSVSKAELKNLAKENSLPEEDYKSLNSADLTEYCAENLCEIPGILKAFEGK